jgi:GNAT superfamily N-acetyltransferase
MSEQAPPIRFRPLTRETLDDLAAFLDGHGKFAYCSCMRWRMRSSEYQESTKGGRGERLKQMVNAGIPVGILAYSGNRPIGWCSIAPRESYEALERYKALPRIDSAAVWSVVCFFVDRDFRRKRVTLGLLQAGLKYARSRGVRIVEGYPVEPGSHLYTYMGSPAIFHKAGFQDVTPKGQKRKVVRCSLESGRS